MQALFGEYGFQYMYYKGLEWIMSFAVKIVPVHRVALSCPTRLRNQVLSMHPAALARCSEHTHKRLQVAIGTRHTASGSTSPSVLSSFNPAELGKAVSNVKPMPLVDHIVPMATGDEVFRGFQPRVQDA